MKKRMMSVVVTLVFLFSVFSTTAFAASYSTLRKGSSGDEVKKLQTLLNQNGYSLTVDGQFGSATENAVELYQKAKGLNPDGIVGTLTWGALLDSAPAQDSTPVRYPTLSIGAKGDDVRQLQTLLNAKGANLTVDGQFGPKTEAALMSFQAANGIAADGIAADSTWTALLPPAGPTAVEDSATISGGLEFLPLKTGATGDKVTQLQQGLANSGFQVAASGTYDAATFDAVKQYQSAFGLSVDGIAGPQTWGRITNVESFIAIAKSKLGAKYVSGGKGPSTFDCSGFVYWCLNQAGVQQSYMTSAVWQKCTAYKRITAMNALQRGDVISYRGHVGIYLGGGQMIDASSSAGKVHISGTNILTSSYWTGHFVAGFRIF